VGRFLSRGGRPAQGGLGDEGGAPDRLGFVVSCGSQYRIILGSAT